MKKLLLFTCLFSFFIIISCSRKEESTEVSLTEKEYLVEQALIEFNKSAIKTGKYDKFINSVAQKSSMEPLSEDELEVMVSDFLGDQTQIFLDVYYQLVALNISQEEFYSISHQFEYLRFGTTSSSKNGGCCGTGGSAGTADKIFFYLIDFFCGCDDDNDDDQE